MIKVLLADDMPLARAGLRTMVEVEDGLLVVGEARDGREAVSLALETSPDVVLMDLSMPGIDGLEATRRIVGDERLAEVKVVIVTTYETDERVFETLRAGASGFLLKDAEPHELIRGIEVVAAGDSLLAPSVTR